MTSIDQQVPVVLALSSHDPSGCTGIQADIETCASLGCHCTPIITALCARDTRSIKDLHYVPTPFLIEQVRAVLEDVPVKAIKLGFLGQINHSGPYDPAGLPPPSRRARTYHAVGG